VLRLEEGIVLEACRVSPTDQNRQGARKTFMPHIGRLWEALAGTGGNSSGAGCWGGKADQRKRLRLICGNGFEADSAQSTSTAITVCLWRIKRLKKSPTIFGKPYFCVSNC